ncbi:MAG: type II toxin-antitoxin system Phd/YefM family antitoxin [Acidobacteria bacterium]|nr:type II toxin-antitoxin system Phd/YefM family antitoxin [Acidobacteriota bacterium]
MENDRGKAEGTRTITTSEFKAKCLKLMDEVAESGNEIVITKNGRPVSRIVPYRNKPQMLFGRHRDKIRILGDIVSPMPAEWFEATDDSGEDLFDTPRRSRSAVAEAHTMSGS